MDERVLVTKAFMPPYEEYIDAIKPLWDTHWVTNMGVYHKQLEMELKKYLGVSEVSLMVNGHMALEMVIQAFGFPRGSEIITTPFTFVSTTHAIVRNGLKPVFCDIKVNDGTIDETKIEELITDKTVAILPVHVYGNVCNVVEIKKIANKYNLKVIYDAAHAFGCLYRGKGIGTYGDASVFSFHATKVFNTIEGGAVSFSNHSTYEKLYDLKNFGIHGEEIVSDVGANAKMNEFCAIMGLCNLKHLDKNICARKDRYNYYKKKLSAIIGINFFDEDIDTKKNYSYLPIIVTDNSCMTRDEIYSKLRKHNIFSRKYFFPLTCDQKCYKKAYEKADLVCARKISKEVLVLPLHDELGYDVIDRIVEIIKN